MHRVGQSSGQQRSAHPVRPALLLGLWVLLTYGFRLVTAIRTRTWDSVTASVVLLGLSVAVAVLALPSRTAGPHSQRPGPGLVRMVRLLDVLAIAWSAFRLVTVWTGQWSAAFRLVHTVIAGVLLILAVWSLAAIHDGRTTIHDGPTAIRAGTPLLEPTAQPTPSPTAPGALAAGSAAEDPPAAEGSAQTVPSGGVDPVSR